MPRAGIALGSNLGDRLQNLRSALDELRAIAISGDPVLTAPVYQTAPLLCPPDSPDFLNTVVEIAFEGTPLELLEKTQSIELKLGRSRCPERNAPRVIDIDLLYLGDEPFNHASLILPHPRIAERRFVLQPLADIRPDLVLIGRETNIATTLKNLASPEPPLTPFAATL